MDETAAANKAMWEDEVRKGCGYSIPWLDLRADMLRAYVSGELDDPPSDFNLLYPPSILRDVEGKRVLCLAAGGGQQSAAYGLLGADVTVVDFVQGQLDGDIKAAEHHGYDLKTILADMRDLSSLGDRSFDLVCQANSISYVPDCGEVFRQVARVVKPGGLYRVNFGQPAAFDLTWDGQAYEITMPYSQKTHRRDDGGIETRHYMSDIFNGLIKSSFSIQSVHDWPAISNKGDPPKPGTWSHEEPFIGSEFAVVCLKTS